MKAAFVLSALVLLGTTILFAQDCTPDGSAFTQLRGSARSVATNHVFLSFDEKAFNRAGDRIAVAIVQTIPDGKITSAQTLKLVLSMLREAFACLSRCVAAPIDRQPNVTLLLLEHLHDNTSGKMRSDIDETKEFIVQQAGSVE